MTGGSERVVEQFIAEFPDADVQVLWNDAPDRFPARTYESWLARTPLRRHKALALPFMPLAWRSLPRKRDYQWMLISSHLFAHHARIRGGREVPRFVYAHTPARYIWEPELDSRGDSALARIGSAVMQPLDRTRAQEVTAIAANSEFTRQRIHRSWNRDARVIYPPVDVDQIQAVAAWADHLDASEEALLDRTPETFLLGASRFVTYKRLDLVIEAGEAADLPVVLAGDGPIRRQLEERAREARVPVLFVGRPSDRLLYSLYQRALAYIFPAIEDFGIMPVEAMAAGARVIVPDRGGAAESVGLIGGGTTFSDHSTQSWRSAIERVMSIDMRRVPHLATQFSNANFREKMRSWVAGWTS